MTSHGYTNTQRVRTGLAIRDMRPDEAQRVAELTIASYDRYGRIEGPYRDALQDPLTRQAGAARLLVAELDGEVVGTVTLVFPGDAQWEGRTVPEGDAGFRVLAVAPEAEGAGVGRALVEASIREAEERGCHRIVIVSMAWMHRAHALYGSLGFVRRADLDVRFDSGDGYVFTRDLSDDAPSRFPPPGPVPDEIPWFRDVWDLVPGEG